METILKLISVMLYLNSLSVVSTYYLFEDKPSSGYASKLNGLSFANYGSLHKKRYTGNGNTKFMRGASAHAVDYQFNSMRSPALNYGGGAALPWNGNDRKIQPNTEAPTKLERPKHETNVNQPPRQRDSREENQSSNDALGKPNVNTPNKRAQISLSNKIAHNDQYTKVQMQESSPIQPASYEMYKTLEVNVNKKPIMSDPQKNLKNRVSSSLSINSFPNYYRRLQTAGNMGMYKTDKYSDPNAPLLHKMLENMSNKLPERRPKSYDSRKRDTSGNIVQMYVVPHDVIKEDLKYSSKEIAKDHLKRADANTFGGIEVNMGSNDKPYAVFYRMNPVALAGPEEIIMNTMDDLPGNNKDKIENVDEVMPSRHEPKHLGSVKIHKKIKNYSSYKKY